MDKQFNFDELHAIVATLRSEHGCPWDKAHTHESLKSTTLEEAYEVNQAVTDFTKTNDPSNLKEELGDLLLQVLFHSQIAEENAEFTLEDVIDGVARKMIRRHPHVFGRKTYASLEEQQADWDAIKEKEHAESLTPKEELSAIPAAFPALIRSQKTAKKAAKYGLLSSDDAVICKAMLESVVALQMSAKDPEDKESIESKLGEALFSITRLAAKYGIHSEIALTRKVDEFIAEH